MRPFTFSLARMGCLPQILTCPLIPLQDDGYIGKTKVPPSSGRVEVQFSDVFTSGKIALIFDGREN